MKRSFLILSLILFTFLSGEAVYSQQIEGRWYGTLSVQNAKLRISFNIQKSDTLYKGTMDSPDQNISGIPIDFVSYSNSVLKIVNSTLNIEYNGIHAGDKILGTFRQSGLSLQLNLSRRIPEGLRRPQEPALPLPYISEEILFINKDDSIVLSGTLTKPDKPGVHDAVILINGSGPQNRDSEIMGHKPFLVLSDMLTKRGIAVLRYDERGVGMSGGDYSKSNTLDLARDVKWALEYLKSRTDIGKVGLIGHSEGGIIAPIVAANSDMVSFLVLLAAPGMKGRDIIMEQQELISLAGGASREDIEAYRSINTKIFDLIEKDGDNPDSLRLKISKILKENTRGELTNNQIKQQVNGLLTPWMLFFLNYDPIPVLSDIKCPVLALNGKKDLQVSYKSNLYHIHRALTGESRIDNNIVTHSNNHVKTVVFEDLNHLFQCSKSGHPNEYSTIEETINISVVETIIDWINEIRRN